MDKYTEDLAEMDDQLYNRMILMKEDAKNRLVSYRHDISEDILVALIFAKVEGIIHAEKVLERLNIDCLDELAILKDFEAFKDEYLERKELENFEVNL